MPVSTMNEWSGIARAIELAANRDAKALRFIKPIPLHLKRIRRILVHPNSTIVQRKTFQAAMEHKGRWIVQLSYNGPKSYTSRVPELTRFGWYSAGIKREHDWEEAMVYMVRIPRPDWAVFHGIILEERL